MSKLKAEAKPLREPLPMGAKTGATVVVEPLLGGELKAPPHFLQTTHEPGTRRAEIQMLGLFSRRSKFNTLPVPAYLVTHPTAGPFLVDTAFHASVSAKPSANLGRTMASFAHPTIEPGRDVPSQLRERGIDSQELGLVVLTHMHFDHTSGIAEYPAATFVVSAPEWEDATNDSKPFMRGYMPNHYDYLFDYRTVDFNQPGVSSYASFGRTFDLFGDGSVRLAFTPGHSAGHCSVICRLSDRDLVIAGDAIYTYDQLEGGDPPPRPFDLHNWRRSLRDLQQFAATYPQAVILPGHDPEHWPTVEKRYE